MTNRPWLNVSGKDHPAWKGGRFIDYGYVMVMAPDHPRANKGGYVREHILVVEAALGHYLPRKAQVHHFNKQRDDNAPANLVACEDGTYHKLLHARAEALELAGNPNLRWCNMCQTWDLLENLTAGGRYAHRHLECQADYQRRWRANRMQS